MCAATPALLTATLSGVQLCIPGIAGVVDETVACNINAALHCGWCKSLGQAALVFQREPRTNSQPETHRLGINRAGVQVQDGRMSGAAVDAKGGGGDKKEEGGCLKIEKKNGGRWSSGEQQRRGGGRQQQRADAGQGRQVAGRNGEQKKKKRERQVKRREGKKQRLESGAREMKEG